MRSEEHTSELQSLMSTLFPYTALCRSESAFGHGGCRIMDRLRQIVGASVAIRVFGTQVTQLSDHVVNGLPVIDEMSGCIETDHYDAVQTDRMQVGIELSDASSIANAVEVDEIGRAHV